VTIHRHPPAVGWRAHVETQRTSKGTVLMRTPTSAVSTIDLDVYDQSVRDEVVLAADAVHATRLRVDYLGKIHRSRDAQGEHLTAAPVAGKQFVVEVAGGKLVVTRDGKPAPDDEAEAVADDYKVMLDPDVFPPGAFAQPLAVGKESPAIEVALTTLLQVSNDDAIVDAPRAVLLGAEGDGPDRSAVFQVEVALAHVLGGGPPIRETLQLAGEWRIALEGGWPTRVTVQGPTSYSSADESQLACEGRGEISLDLRRTYGGGAPGS